MTTAELALKPDGKVILVCFYTMFTPENCSDTGVRQHYWHIGDKSHNGKCMCGEIDWSVIEEQIKKWMEENA